MPALVIALHIIAIVLAAVLLLSSSAVALEAFLTVATVYTAGVVMGWMSGTQGRIKVVDISKVHRRRYKNGADEDASRIQHGG